MPDTGSLLGLALVSAATTWALRAVPFAVLAPLRNRPRIARLATQLPTGAMVILALATIRDLPLHHPNHATGLALALAITTALQLWRHNAALSIIAGTTTHLLISTAA
jgi:branched-subunit amino acid transport protein AzlD